MTRRSRLLIVDDQPSNRALIRRYLASSDYDLFEAIDGREALDVFEAWRPDLVLLDLVMPELDGMDVLLHVRAHPELGETPVVLLTAHGDRERRVQGLEAGADDFLEQPIDAPVLRARVRTLLHLKSSRDDLRERHGQLERLQRQQAELMQFIVHDLRGPLTSVTANAEWVYQSLQPQDETVLRALEDLMLGTTRLRSMVADLLAVSQLEQGTFPVRREQVGIGPVVDRVVNAYRGLADQKGIAILVPSRFDARISMDAALIQRVLENLLDNSLRYTPESGRVSVAAECGDELEIAVANTGPAIPESQRKFVFEKFARIDEQARAGAGLGLYFCKQVVEAHGGSIDIVETDEYPTCFRIRLPAA